MLQKNNRLGGQPGRLGAKRGDVSAPDYNRKRAKNSTPIYVGTKIIGFVADGVFNKTIRGSIHMLRRPKAIAFDVSTLHDAEQAGAYKVSVTDTDTGQIYEAALSTIWAKGFEFDRGYGRQWGVPIGDWNKDNKSQQLPLFGWPV